MSDLQNPRATTPGSALSLDSQTRKRVKQDSPHPASTSGKTRGNPSFSEPTKRLDPAGAAVLANLMVGYRLDATFRALADPTRRALLARLAGSEKRVTELTRGFAMSETAAAKHLALLEAAGLVRRRRDGRHSFCALAADPLTEVALWLRRWQRFESRRAAGLRRLLDVAQGPERRPPPP
jgi:DNA-binding transcriptional ArsR family regulator